MYPIYPIASHTPLYGKVPQRREGGDAYSVWEEEPKSHYSFLWNKQKKTKHRKKILSESDGWLLFVILATT